MSTSFNYGLPYPTDVKLEIFNILGQRVIQLVDGYREAGYHDVTFDASHLASGLYLYKIEAGDFTSVKKMVLLK